MKRKIIINGANGFVGSWVCKEMLDHGYEVLAIDLTDNPYRLDLSNSSLTYLNSKKEGGISIILGKGPFDCFYDFAWRGSAGDERGDEKIQLENALNMANDLRIAHKAGCRRFVGVGSITELVTLDVSFEQGSKPGLAYIYGAGKIAAYTICKSIANSLGIDFIWGQITNAYGVGETAPRFLLNTVKNIIHDKPLQFTSGTQNYDFVYISDVAKAFRLIYEKGIANKSYLIGSGHPRPLREFILEMGKELGVSDRIVFGDVPYTGAMSPIEDFSTKDLYEDCGYESEVPFNKGIMMMYEYVKGMEEDR